MLLVVGMRRGRKTKEKYPFLVLDWTNDCNSKWVQFVRGLRETMCSKMPHYFELEAHPYKVNIWEMRVSEFSDYNKIKCAVKF